MFISLNMLRKKAICETELLSKNEIENFVRILYTEYNSAYTTKTMFQLLSVLSKLRQFTSHYFDFYVFIKQRLYTRIETYIAENKLEQSAVRKMLSSLARHVCFEKIRHEMGKRVEEQKSTTWRGGILT